MSSAPTAVRASCAGARRSSSPTTTSRRTGSSATSASGASSSALPTFRQVCDPAQPIAIVQIGPDHHRFSFMLDRDEPPERATDSDASGSASLRYLGRDEAELVRRRQLRVPLADRRALARRAVPARGRRGARDAAVPRAGHVLGNPRQPQPRLEARPRSCAGRPIAAILDTYQPEREPHVRFITEKAIELGRVQTLRDPVGGERPRRPAARTARARTRRRRRSASRASRPDLSPKAST